MIIKISKQLSWISCPLTVWLDDSHSSLSEFGNTKDALKVQATIVFLGISPLHPEFSANVLSILHHLYKYQSSAVLSTPSSLIISLEHKHPNTQTHSNSADRYLTILFLNGFSHSLLTIFTNGFTLSSAVIGYYTGNVHLFLFSHFSFSFF